MTSGSTSNGGQSRECTDSWFANATVKHPHRNVVATCVRAYLPRDLTNLCVEYVPKGFKINCAISKARLALDKAKTNVVLQRRKAEAIRTRDKPRHMTGSMEKMRTALTRCMSKLRVACCTLRFEIDKQMLKDEYERVQLLTQNNYIREMATIEVRTDVEAEQRIERASLRGHEYYLNEVFSIPWCECEDAARRKDTPPICEFHKFGQEYI